MASKPPDIPVADLRLWIAQPRFNLSEEPWIDVATESGAERLGLRELFRRSHEVIDVVATTDVERWAMHLFLIAVGATLLQRPAPGAGPPGELDPDAVDRHFDDCAERLWLFHPTDPFMQQVGLIDRLAKDQKVGAREGGGTRSVVSVNTVKTLAVELAAKDKHTWWDHVPDEHPVDGWFTLEPAAAARLLITRSLFGEGGNEMGTGNKNSPEGLYGAADANGRGLLLVMRTGRTLLETICANVLADDLGGEGLAAADLTSPGGVDRPLTELSPLERALWTPKATLLIPPEPGSGEAVSWVLRAARQTPPTGSDKNEVTSLRAELRKQFRAHSPHTITRLWKDELRFVWMDPRKDAWRELPAIAESFSEGSGTRSILSPHALAFPTDTPVETLGCEFRGTATSRVLDGWRISELPDELIADPAVAAEIARHLEQDGTLSVAANRLRYWSRFVALPSRDAEGAPTAPPHDLPDPELVADALATFWDEAKRLSLKLASEVTGTDPIDTPAWWSASVTDTAERCGTWLFDRVDASDPTRVFHTARARRGLHLALQKLRTDPPTEEKS